MNSQCRQNSRGYSLAELMTVVAIIGIMSLVSVPAFMSYRNIAALKNGLRTVSQDLRTARQMAITHHRQVKLEFTTNSTSYDFLESLDGGTTWTTPNVKGLSGARRELPESIFIESATFTDLNDNSKLDVVYLPNGTVELGTGVTERSITIRSEKPIDNPRAVITVRPSGYITSTRASA